MIGNDIVDLALARKESNWKRKGFLDKIFTEKEQLHILQSLIPEMMVWNLWSRKEAAYKIYNRETGIRGYFPLQFECIDLNSINDVVFGKVCLKGKVYFTKTEITKQYINTIAVQNELDLTHIRILKNREGIKKIDGIPSYFNNENLHSNPVSISNHGRFEQIISI
jgi:phosphopantetheinyl transferase (holo-ACP synthase)